MTSLPEADPFAQCERLFRLGRSGRRTHPELRVVLPSCGHAQWDFVTRCEAVPLAGRLDQPSAVAPIRVALRDGSQMLLRPAMSGDADVLAEGSERFSDETLYRRFLSHCTPSTAMLQYLFEVNYVDHFAWVLVEPASDAVVAVGRFVRECRGSDRGEIAFTVADAYQGRGIGTLLMDAVIIAADLAGLRLLTARMFSCNSEMRAMLRRFAVAWTRDEPDVVSASFGLPGHGGLRVEASVIWQIRIAAAQMIRAGSESGNQ